MKKNRKKICGAPFDQSQSKVRETRRDTAERPVSESQQARKTVLRFNSFFFFTRQFRERGRDGKRQRFKWMGVETAHREPMETCFCRRKGLKMSDDAAHAPHQHKARRAGGEKWRGSARRAHAALALAHAHTPRADRTGACR